MARYVSFYAEGRHTQVFSCGCGWSGRLADMSMGEMFRELVEYECPDCHTRLVNKGYPTEEEAHEAAKRGDAEAIRDLHSFEKAAKERARMEASELTTPNQLPELELTEPTKFVWDLEEHDREPWAVVRVAGSGTEVWRELTYFEAWPRAVAVRSLLKSRYRKMFAGLVCTRRSEMYLLGDDFNAVRLPPADDEDAPWVAHADGEPPEPPAG